MILRLHCCIPVVLAILIAGAEAQDQQRAHEAGGRARDLAAKGDWAGAERVLREQLQRLGDDDATKGARAVLDFNLAWVKEDQARKLGEGEKEDAAAALREAEAAYRRVLDAYPKNAQAAINLSQLLERSGREVEASGPLIRALEAGSSSTLELELAHGDLLIRNGEPGQAWQQFKRLVEKFPESRAVNERLRQVFSRHTLGPNNANWYFFRCVEMKLKGFLSLSKDGMEDLIKKAWNSRFAADAGVAERALIEWAELHVLDGELTETDLGRLPPVQDWDSPALKGLHQLVAGNPQDAPWWREDHRRRHTASGVLRVGGDRLAAAGKIDEAVGFYEKAMEVAPAAQHYSPGDAPETPMARWSSTPLLGKPMARLEAASRMAEVLYSAQDFKGDRQKKLDNLLSDLWEEKTAQYRAGNVDAMRRYHQTLAVIHTEQKDSESAQYHLGRLLEIEGGEAKKENRAEDPQPQVHRMLAISYERKDDRVAASASYLKASQGYLLREDQKNASETLGKVERRVLKADDQDEFARIETSIRLTNELLGPQGRLDPERWGALVRLHEEAKRDSPAKRGDWGPAHLDAVARQAETKERLLGNETQAKEWARKREDLQIPERVRIPKDSRGLREQFRREGLRRERSEGEK